MSTPNYITLADLQQLFSADEVAKYASQDGIDMAQVIALTNEEVHGYLAPLIGTAVLGSVPMALKVRAADIARFYANKDVAAEDSPMVVRWKAAVRYLERVGEGKQPIVLDLQDNPATEGDDVADATGVWCERGPNTLDDREFASSFW